MEEKRDVAREPHRGHFKRLAKSSDEGKLRRASTPKSQGPSLFVMMESGFRIRLAQPGIYSHVRSLSPYRNVACSSQSSRNESGLADEIARHLSLWASDFSQGLRSGIFNFRVGREASLETGSHSTETRFES